MSNSLTRFLLRNQAKFNNTDSMIELLKSCFDRQNKFIETGFYLSIKALYNELRNDDQADHPKIAAAFKQQFETRGRGVSGSLDDTGLMQICETGAATPYIAQHKGVLNQADEFGDYPLLVACMHGQLEVIKELMKQGTNPLANDIIHLIGQLPGCQQVMFIRPPSQAGGSPVVHAEKYSLHGEKAKVRVFGNDSRSMTVAPDGHSTQEVYRIDTHKITKHQICYQVLNEARKGIIVYDNDGTKRAKLFFGNDQVGVDVKFEVKNGLSWLIQGDNDELLVFIDKTSMHKRHECLIVTPQVQALTIILDYIQNSYYAAAKQSNEQTPTERYQDKTINQFIFHHTKRKQRDFLCQINEKQVIDLFPANCEFVGTCKSKREIDLFVKKNRSIFVYDMNRAYVHSSEIGYADMALSESPALSLYLAFRHISSITKNELLQDFVVGLGHQGGGRDNLTAKSWNGFMNVGRFALHTLWNFIGVHLTSKTGGLRMRCYRKPDGRINDQAIAFQEVELITRIGMDDTFNKDHIYPKMNPEKNQMNPEMNPDEDEIPLAIVSEYRIEATANGVVMKVESCGIVFNDKANIDDDVKDKIDQFRQSLHYCLENNFVRRRVLTGLPDNFTEFLKTFREQILNNLDLQQWLGNKPKMKKQIQVPRWRPVNFDKLVGLEKQFKEFCKSLKILGELDLDNYSPIQLSSLVLFAKWASYCHILRLTHCDWLTRLSDGDNTMVFNNIRILKLENNPNLRVVKIKATQQLVHLYLNSCPSLEFGKCVFSCNSLDTLTLIDNSHLTMGDLMKLLVSFGKLTTLNISGCVGIFPIDDRCKRQQFASVEKLSVKNIPSLTDRDIETLYQLFPNLKEIYLANSAKDKSAKLVKYRYLQHLGNKDEVEQSHLHVDSANELVNLATYRSLTMACDMQLPDNINGIDYLDASNVKLDKNFQVTSNTLHTLFIDNCSNVDLSTIKLDCPQLTRLSLAGTDKIQLMQLIQLIKHLPELRELDISRCMIGLNDTSLNNDVIDWVTQIRLISTPAVGMKMTLLTQLFHRFPKARIDVRGCAQLESFWQAIAHCRNNSSVKTFIIPSGVTFNSLTSASISSYIREMTTVIVKGTDKTQMGDLDPITVHSTRLELTNNQLLQEINLISDNLVELVIKGSPQLVLMHCRLHCQELQLLAIHNHDQIMPLTVLELLDNSFSFSQLPKLTQLDFTGCHNLTNFAQVVSYGKQYKQIRTLTLSNIDELKDEDIPVILILFPNLTMLKVDGCYRLRVYEFLQHMDKFNDMLLSKRIDEYFKLTPMVGNNRSLVARLGSGLADNANSATTAADAAVAATSSNIVSDDNDAAPNPQINVQSL